MAKQDLTQYLSQNSYPGRGIIAGRSEDGKHAVIAYFIMGRSKNSRNRIFATEGEGIRTQAFDPAKLADPSLIIYSPVKVLDDLTVVTNGDQTDTIYDHLVRGGTFEEALRTRTFEPDGPNYTPRISALLQGFTYKLSILKSADGNPESGRRFFFEYGTSIPGEGHFIHTYEGDGTPLPSFEGEPRRVNISGDIDTFAKALWQNLNEDNKVSLFVRYLDVEVGKTETRIFNKNGGGQPA